MASNLNYYLWMYLKSKIYEGQMRTMVNLKWIQTNSNLCRSFAANNVKPEECVYNERHHQKNTVFFKVIASSKIL